MRIIECVPNFSEGRDRDKISAIANVFHSFSGIRLVDFSGDADHNRSVFTVLGKPKDVFDAMLAAAGRAIELIDMRAQAGVHPRLGAVDVVPFVPLLETGMEEAVSLAYLFGRQFFKNFGVPVYFYGEAAMIPGRKVLANIRRGGYERLYDKMNHPLDAPDIGSQRFNPRAGATVVGARAPLVAFNINLNCNDLTVAKKMASFVREKNGGLKYLQAIGVELKSRGLVQVSMNLTNCRETPLKMVYDQVKSLADDHGIEILESELIGLAPQCAFAGTTPEELKMTGFGYERLLEEHLSEFTRM
jgi:glutamate formiminotransferase / 5-formyltetrahydrofolate cyclo-ligase